ncbi:MAG TPA: hypothetical protein VFT47_13415 [Vicinamibacterales bacterium]|nr:hypothetical protein [Vicinamibacterales bacterium]
MSYDLHLVRTKNWLEASSAPISKQDVDALIASDPELTWSTADYVEMGDDAGAVTRYYMIIWRGQPCFWWYRDQIQCSDPDEAQQAKLVQMARALDAFAVGDDGETYGEDAGLPQLQTVSFGERVAGWLARLRSPRQPVIEHQPLPFGVGDRVRDLWGHEHTVMSIDPTAEHGLGVIRTRRGDGTEHEHAMSAHGLELTAKR